MGPIFILTRAFFVSALFVGILPRSWAAPIPPTASAQMEKRFMGACRLGCMFAEPNASPAPTPTSAAESLSGILGIIQAASPFPSQLDSPSDSGDLPDTLLLLPGTATAGDVEESAPIVAVEVIDLNRPAGSLQEPPTSVVDDILAAVPEIISRETQPDVAEPRVPIIHPRLHPIATAYVSV